jgi:hypothetical protein
MKKQWVRIWVLTTVLLIVLVPMRLAAKGGTQQWELVDPEGVIRIDPMTLRPHPATLESKTVMLRWNGKHNGDVFLNRIAQLLVEHIDGVKIVKSWEVAPDTVNAITGSQEKSLAVAAKLSQYKPHIVIGAQAD